MNGMIRALAGLLLAAFAAPDGAAQQTPQPILRAHLEPPRVVVGQPVRLRIEVLAPNYLTGPPTLPDFQLHNAVTRALGGINLTERHDGLTYAGLMREFAIHPQEPGSYAIADQNVTVVYAAEPPAGREAVLSLPRLAFEAFIPDAAQALDPFIAANRLALNQIVEPAPGELKVGDALVRTVTIEAEGLPAMLLPPVHLTAPDGLAVYPDQPILQDRSDRRADTLMASRVERVTYMLERPGDYVLPGVEIAWWTLRDGRIERARTDPVTLHVAANPAVPQGGAGEAVSAEASRWTALLTRLQDRWPLAVLVLAALAGLAWLAPRALRAAHGWLDRRRAAYRSSEAASFAHLRAAARGGDPARAYFALLAWLERFEPLGPARTVDALRSAAQDPALDRELARIEARLFGDGGNDASDWSPRHLLRRVAAARRRLAHRSATRLPARMQIAPLNPDAAPAPTHSRWRPVAR